MNKLLLIVLIGALLQLVGCATNTKPHAQAPVIEKTNPIVKPEVVQPAKPNETIAAPQVMPQTKPAAPIGNAVASLAAQARAQYQAKNYQAAVATAERGLRIDRRAPELYLVLAQSYVQLANVQLAQQFVQQGIRYAQAGTDVAQNLLKIRDALPH